MSTRSPYRPPAARVADSSSGERPGAIKLALWLIALYALVKSYHQFVDLAEVRNGEMSGLEWLVQWLWVAAIPVAGFFIAKGRRLARWVLLVLLIRELYYLGDALLFLSTFEEGSAREIIGTLPLVMLPLASIFSLAATILVFGPGRGWFERRDG